MTDRKHSVLYLSLLCLMLLRLFSGCSGWRYLPPRVEPIIRVGILQDVDSFMFTAEGRLEVLTLRQEQSFSLEKSGAWLVSLPSSQPAGAAYRCMLYESDDRDRANASAAAWRRKGYAVDVVVRGEELRAGSRTIVDHRSYAVALSETFAQRVDAESHLRAAFAGTGGRIYREILKPATGRISLLSPDKKTRVIDGGMRLAGAAVTINRVEVGRGFHWNRTESRTYGGELEVSLTPQGKLSVINVLPMERYLVGVVAGEMPATFPAEALKAQAIVSRTVLLRHFGRVHREDDFDVCDDVHCQAYIGLTKHSGAVENAVYATRGLVLTHNDELCDASYSAVCGGHTENAADVWQGSDVPYLRGRLDTLEPLRGFDLRDEANARLWIESEPRVCCNQGGADNPAFARYAQKYFRWQESASREEMEKIIAAKTGETFGQLRDIVPVSRGLSGRIKELRIVGSDKSLTLKKELNIRRALSATALYSACFVVDRTEGAHGLPGRFVIKGAGWGHGVGMCQVGAGLRAHQGKMVNEILAAYYSDVRIRQIY